MNDTESDYCGLLPIRDVVFPTFDADQKRAASVISDELLRCGVAGEIAWIVELGCGTGEIVDEVRRLMTNSCGHRATALGVDCSSAEIAIARALHSECEFVEGRAESFVRSEGSGPDRLSPERTLLMCVGHTIAHFQNTEGFLDGLAVWGPRVVLVDFYMDWDAVVRHFDAPGAAPVRQLKQSARMSSGELVAHTLVTKRHADDPDRVLRGIETSVEGRSGMTGFWTTQICRSSSWFLNEFGKRGYAGLRELSYTGGYGPMRGFLLLRS